VFQIELEFQATRGLKGLRGTLVSWVKGGTKGGSYLDLSRGEGESKRAWRRIKTGNLGLDSLVSEEGSQDKRK